MSLTLEDIAKMSTEAKVIARWRLQARPAQLPPDDDWLIWLVLAGRGWGKTRTGASWLAEQAVRGGERDWMVVAPTYRDVRNTCVEGRSGLLAALHPRLVTHWNRSLGELVLTNGARIYALSAEEPDRIRGANLAGAWCDELAAWPDEATWYEALVPALRIGDRPRVVATTTPRPTHLLRDILSRADGTVTVTRGSTYDNAANLSATALAELRTRYEGTRLGRQELHGEMLTDTPGALWTAELIEANRVSAAPPLRRVVVAIDPAVTSGEDSDDTGIVVAAMGVDGHVYVLEDATVHTSPEAWARTAIGAYDRWSGDRIVGEVNNGGDLVESVLRAVDRQIPYTKVHASRGKRVRAEPVAALYEQGLVHHVGRFPELEDGTTRKPGMTSWVVDSSESPDRVDALVWAVTDLALSARKGRRALLDIEAA